MIEVVQTATSATLLNCNGIVADRIRTGIFIFVFVGRKPLSNAPPRLCVVRSVDVICQALSIDPWDQPPHACGVSIVFCAKVLAQQPLFGPNTRH